MGTAPPPILHIHMPLFQSRFMIKKSTFWLLLCCCACTTGKNTQVQKTSGNPVFEGWYADPEIRIFNNTFWIFPTYSDKYEKQVFFDAFSSSDLTGWVKHPHILDTAAIRWANKAVWAPSVTEKKGRYYIFFGANDIQSDKEYGGIGVAVSEKPQ